MGESLVFAGVFVSAIIVPMLPITQLKVAGAYGALWLIVWGIVAMAVDGHGPSLWFMAPSAVLVLVTIASSAQSPFPFRQGFRPGIFRGDGILTTAAYAATVLGAALLSRDAGVWIERYLVIGGTIMAVVGIAQSCNFRWAIWLGCMANGFHIFDERAYATLNNPVFAGAVFLTLTPLASYLALHESWWWMLPGAFMTTALWLTVSRGAWLGMAAGLIVLLIRDPLAGGICAILLACGWLAAYAHWYERKHRAVAPIPGRTRRVNLTHTGSLSGRWFIWRCALDLWTKMPLLGWGNNSIAVRTQDGSDIYDTMHAEPLQILVTTGITGLVATAVVFGAFIHPFASPEITAALAGYLLWVMSEWGHVGAHNIFWALVGISYALAH